MNANKDLTHTEGPKPMPTKTKTQTKAELTQATADLFEKGRRIVAGENYRDVYERSPDGVKSKSRSNEATSTDNPPAAPKPRLRLLSEISDQEMTALRFKIVGAALNLDPAFITYLASAVDVLQNYKGCNSPVEEFIVGGLLCYEMGHVSPEDFEDHLEEFKENLKSAEEDAKIFARMYPERFAEMINA
jgi:hypothetical protein